MTMNFLKTAAILLICFTSGIANAVDFEQRILPLFYRRCFNCHSEKKEKPKGGLKLDSVKAIRESGVIAPGKPDESELLIRISLSHEDDGFMPPPKGGAQPLDADELAMMKAWIRRSTPFPHAPGLHGSQLSMRSPSRSTGASLTRKSVSLTLIPRRLPS